jgi:hypothetical protein
MASCDTAFSPEFEIVARPVALAVDSPQTAFLKPKAREASMQKLLVVMFAGLVACVSAYAADTKTDAKTDAMNPQQNKMKACQAEAGDKKLEGKARQDYVNNCLKAKPVKAKSKLAECNAKTKGMSKADADKTRSECMKA